MAEIMDGQERNTMLYAFTERIYSQHEKINKPKHQINPWNIFTIHLHIFYLGHMPYERSFYERRPYIWSA